MTANKKTDTGAILPSIADPADAKIKNEDIATEETAAPEASDPKLDPTRFGDWEKNGRCIDF